MGMFDTLVLKCPNCDTENEVQSKMGPCVMERFTVANAPLCVLEDVSHKLFKCSECNEPIKLHLEYRAKTVIYGDEESRWKSATP